MSARNYNLASGLRADARSSISYRFLFRAHRLVDARHRSGRVRRLSRTGFGQPALLADAIADVPSDNLRHAFDERSEEHTSELQSLMRISYAVFCLKKKNKTTTT